MLHSILSQLQATPPLRTFEQGHSPPTPNHVVEVSHADDGIGRQTTATGRGMQKDTVLRTSGATLAMTLAQAERMSLTGMICKNTGNGYKRGPALAGDHVTENPLPGGSLLDL